MDNPSIVITSPSIDISKNVNGISNLTQLLLEKNKDVNYLHFIVGKNNSQRRNIRWLFNQFTLIFNFYKKLLADKKIQITHINIPLSELSIFINFLLVIIAKIAGKKIIVHFRGGRLSLNRDINFIQKFTIGKSIQLADKVIVLGSKERNYISEFYKITNKEKIAILPNSVDIPKSIHESKLLSSKEDKQFKIIFIGRIDKNKGLEELILALEAIKSKINFHFYLAGTGPDEESFVSKCISTLGDKFSFLGVLNSIDKVPFYENADIFILPSYFEGLPNALLEAMAYGVVPIATPVGSIPEVVENNKNGFIIPINNYQEISKRIILLYHDRILLKQLGEASHQTIFESYSIDNYIVKLNKVYDSVIFK